MTADELKAIQAPLKARYKADPEAAKSVLRASGVVDPDAVTCRVDAAGGPIDAGLHPLAGGDGSWACSGEILLQSLVACAGVTLAAVAKAMGIAVRNATVRAEGDLDFRGTLGVDRSTPVGFSEVRLNFDLDSDATPEQRTKLLELTERYCVVFRTLADPPAVRSSITGSDSLSNT